MKREEGGGGMLLVLVLLRRGTQRWVYEAVARECEYDHPHAVLDGMLMERTHQCMFMYENNLKYMIFTVANNTKPRVENVITVQILQ